MSALVFPTTKGPGWTPDEMFISALRSAYPGINIDEEMLRAWLWCSANVRNRKTMKGMPRFLNSWIARCEDRRQSAIRAAHVKFYQPQRRVLNESLAVRK